MSAQTSPVFTATATGADMLVGGEQFPRRIKSVTPFDLAIPAQEGQTIELTATASAEPIGVPINLDVWVLDQKGRDRRALSGSVIPGKHMTWQLPDRMSEPVELTHQFKVRPNDPVGGVVHLCLVTISQFGARRLYIGTAPLTWTGQVVGRRTTP